ncbi:MAG: anthranilate phosphoribosyltransferase [Candidatus Scalindua sp. AMX11]|nr:MAG: anthranilate phosphoribosyltransferase [Candidatus Scalindua sp.]NOG82388.1 anthranilate phosphoribosyltransferase [Planctomycetota bacterium]RZV70601.1 MAG: anthranilate phosphoribosyltransferase [Candidatus Scalindua sp. SCAELEC01]TDE64215.1 MAG: anthranilate phosphoribosyltransferase [Candidatus Scalindua sp. AMX11]
MLIKEIIGKVVEGRDLSIDESKAIISEIMDGKVTGVQIGAFITALRMKGETVDEITGCAMVMREKATRIDTGNDIVVDTCGTGGDSKCTFNISTAAAFVVAGAGLKVAKHGSTASSSHCGSADVLKLLGVNVKAAPEIVERCIREVNIGFLLAPLLHGSMKYAVLPRREIGIKTIFNILGPLTNPARTKRQVIGVYEAKLTDTVAKVLKNLGTEHAFVVYGYDGLDEITTTDKTKVCELKNGKIKSYFITHESFGIEKAEIKDFVVQSPEESATAINKILSGTKGPMRDIVLLNASAAIVAGGGAPDLRHGIRLAAESVDSGRAKVSLDRLVKISQES